ncbi:MAG: polysaccharide deacetylase family protein [Bacteroidota bacterium]
MEESKQNNNSENFQRLEKRWEQFYFVKTPWWLKKIYSSYIWSIDTKKKELYLTFDDGPHPEITSFVLKQLKQYNALATFFCIGKNVVAYPEIYRQISDEGHSIGNHTYNHLNGWATKDEIYLKDVAEASKYIDSILFRPCYGRLTNFQAKNLKKVMKGKEPKIIMWDVLSGDFDTNLPAKECAANVILQSVPGSIVVFHESEKAYPRLEYALPKTLQYFSEKGYAFKDLS